MDGPLCETNEVLAKYDNSFFSRNFLNIIFKNLQTGRCNVKENLKFFWHDNLEFIWNSPTRQRFSFALYSINNFFFNSLCFSDGWEQLGLFEFFKAKQKAKKTKFEHSSTYRRTSSRSPSPRPRHRASRKSRCEICSIKFHIQYRVVVEAEQNGYNFLIYFLFTFANNIMILA